ncbi:hypothetical protein HK097_004449 [Rhizophlyctis rosea]|uniref:UspA domain-containing protein n=1 Tax=Rhizophlyctis rosea TaxID=64517 RepID=A0AAD5SHD9_9FUNG|nr:hypothetical protein HK097_004449 [Rhizophlyctis rosea]
MPSRPPTRPQSPQGIELKIFYNDVIIQTTSNTSQDNNETKMMTPSDVEPGSPTNVTATGTGSGRVPKTVLVGMSESAASVNALKFVLGNVAAEGDSVVVVTVVEDSAEVHATTERMKTLLTVTRESYSKAVKVTLRVLVGEPGTVLVEQAFKTHPSSVIIGSTLHSMSTGITSYITNAHTIVTNPIATRILENTPPSIPVITVRYIPADQVEDDHLKKRESVWDL